MLKRISHKQLEYWDAALSERDKHILVSIRNFRYMTTDQIRRLYFAESATATAALRAASRNLKKLKEFHLIGHLARRIGGVRAGSGSYVWRLEAAGDHLLSLNGRVEQPRRKRFEPSAYFLTHTLAVAECYVRIMEICDGQNVRLTDIQPEPYNWRPYNSGGKLVSLKPDLFAVTVCDAYEDRWFFELDMATESGVRIVEKCRRYHQYYQSGLEQKQYGVFPLVVWIVPDAKRKRSIIQHIKAEFSKLPNIFTVITLDELDALMHQSIEMQGGITL